jgi:hypothetical protein
MKTGRLWTETSYDLRTQYAAYQIASESASTGNVSCAHIAVAGQVLVDRQTMVFPRPSQIDFLTVRMSASDDAI